MTDIDYLKKYYDGDISSAIKRLNDGEAVQYIVGNVDFCGNKIKVNKNVLIPRFETEELVMKTYEYIKQLFSDKGKILDLATGSGCIAITLKKLLPNYQVTASDISPEALQVAKENADGLDIAFFEGDMLEPITDKYDIIISNPPYLTPDDDIMDIVISNEPHLALFASNNGLYYYEKILKNIKKYLNKKSLIAFEIGENQAEEISKYIEKYLPNATYKIENDMQNRNRFIFIFNN